MRAIVKCTASTRLEGDAQRDKLLKQLDDHDWLPKLPQDDPEITARKTEILSHVAQDDRNMVEKTLFYTVYDEDTKTWGIVNNPTSHAFTFRLKNPISDRLKAATEKLVADLSSVTAGGKQRADGGIFHFHTQVVVLEPTSEHSAYLGEILPAKGFVLAMRERKRETYVGVLTLFLTAFFMATSSPFLSTAFFGKLAQPWQDWITGNLSRFATAASVAATISWFEVILYWFQVRRQSAIRWTLE